MNISDSKLEAFQSNLANDFQLAEFFFADDAEFQDIYARFKAVESRGDNDSRFEALKDCFNDLYDMTLTVVCVDNVSAVRIGTSWFSRFVSEADYCYADDGLVADISRNRLTNFSPDFNHMDNGTHTVRVMLRKI